MRSGTEPRSQRRGVHLAVGLEWDVLEARGLHAGVVAAEAEPEVGQERQAALWRPVAGRRRGRSSGSSCRAGRAVDDDVVVGRHPGERDRQLVAAGHEHRPQVDVGRAVDGAHVQRVGVDAQPADGGRRLGERVVRLERLRDRGRGGGVDRGARRLATGAQRELRPAGRRCSDPVRAVTRTTDPKPAVPSCSSVVVPLVDRRSAATTPPSSTTPPSASFQPAGSSIVSTSGVAPDRRRADDHRVGDGAAASVGVGECRAAEVEPVPRDVLAGDEPVEDLAEGDVVDVRRAEGVEQLFDGETGEARRGRRSRSPSPPWSRRRSRPA